MPKCALCGTDLPLIDAHALWHEGKRICQNCAGKSQLVENIATTLPLAPLVGEFDVWAPIIWLVGMILLGFFSWVLGLRAYRCHDIRVLQRQEVWNRRQSCGADLRVRHNRVTPLRPRSAQASNGAADGPPWNIC